MSVNKYNDLNHLFLMQCIFADKELASVYQQAFCAVAQISAPTFYAWKKKHPEFKKYVDLGRSDSSKLKNYKIEVPEETRVLTVAKLTKYKNSLSSEFSVPSRRDEGKRLSSYDPDVHIPLIFKLFSEGKTHSIFCREAQIARSTFFSWRKQHPDFEAAYREASVLAQAYWDELFMNETNNLDFYYKMYRRRFSESIPIKATDKAVDIIKVAQEGLNDEIIKEYKLSLDDSQKLMNIAEKRAILEQTPVLASDDEEEKDRVLSLEATTNKEAEVEELLLDSLTELKRKYDCAKDGEHKLKLKERIQRIINTLIDDK